MGKKLKCLGKIRNGKRLDTNFGMYSYTTKLLNCMSEGIKRSVFSQAPKKKQIRQFQTCKNWYF